MLPNLGIEDQVVEVDIHESGATKILAQHATLLEQLLCLIALSGRLGDDGLTISLIYDGHFGFRGFSRRRDGLAYAWHNLQDPSVATLICNVLIA